MSANATESALTTILFQTLSQMTKAFDLIEYNTRDQYNPSERDALLHPDTI